jgi:hypothetical protein
MARFHVIFHTSYTEDQERLGRPTEYLYLPEGVILEETPVRTSLPSAMEYAERTEGEDVVDYVGTETWEYEVEDSRREEFRETLRNCPLVVEFAELPAAA